MGVYRQYHEERVQRYDEEEKERKRILEEEKERERMLAEEREKRRAEDKEATEEMEAREAMEAMEAMEEREKEQPGKRGKKKGKAAEKVAIVVPPFRLTDFVTTNPPPVPPTRPYIPPEGNVLSKELSVWLTRVVESGRYTPPPERLPTCPEIEALKVPKFYAAVKKRSKPRWAELISAALLWSTIDTRGIFSVNPEHAFNLPPAAHVADAVLAGLAGQFLEVRLRIPKRPIVREILNTQDGVFLVIVPTSGIGIALWYAPYSSLLPPLFLPPPSPPPQRHSQIS